MATYKLIQDIEAEDKILGPLTLRQFIFGLVGAFFAYLSVFVVTRGVAFLLIVFLPPAIFCILFAFPFGRDQPTEIWLLAKLRFWFFPRKRIWDQSGVKELVTITVPKKIERVLTDGLSQSEVKSRLQTLANTIDSRGWAIKNIDNTYAQPAFVSGDSSSERLIDLNNILQPSQDNTTDSDDDILDPNTSTLAHHVDEMVKQASVVHRQQLVNQLNAQQVTPAPAKTTGWFMGQPANPATQSSSQPIAPIAPSPNPVTPAIQPNMDTAEEQALSDQLKTQSQTQQIAWNHLRTINPTGTKSAPKPMAQPAESSQSTLNAPVPPVNHTFNPAILELAGNDDLNVSTLAREAKKAADEMSHSSDEVVIPLH